MNDYPRERLGWETAKRAFTTAMEIEEKAV